LNLPYLIYFFLNSTTRAYCSEVYSFFRVLYGADVISPDYTELVGIRETNR